MIILLGFPKSGTISFSELFTELNYNTFHWVYKNDHDYIGNRIKDNKFNEIQLLSFFDEPIDNIAITQMDICINKYCCYWPQLIDFKLLYEQYPDAIFILNTRDPIKILNSMKKWQDFDKRIMNFNPELFVGLIGNDDEKIIQLIQVHYHNVRLFFQNLPNSKFIEYDIDNDNITKLNKYIDTKGLEFPESNKSI